MHKFVVFADSRTGGTHLVSSLKSHPQIACVSEPFPHYGLDDHSTQVAWSDDYFLDHERRGQLAAGYRLKVTQLASPDEFATYLAEHEIRPCRLTRRNVVKQAISRLRGIALFRESGDYNVKGERAPLGSTRIGVAALQNQIEQLLALKQEETDFFAALTVPGKTELVYEDMLINGEGYFSRLYDVFGVDPNHKPSSNVSKNTSDRLADSVLNYDELVEALAGTPYEAMLRE